MVSWKYQDEDKGFIAKINSYFNRPSDVIVAKYLSFILNKLKALSGWNEANDSFSQFQEPFDLNNHAEIE